MNPKFTLDYFNQRGVGRFPHYLGIRVTAIGDGELSAELDVVEHLLAPNGFLHAGSVVTLADTACGYGCISHLPDGADNFTTVELKSNHLGTLREGVLAVTAKAVHLGRTTQVWDATVTAKATGKTIALFRCTQMVLYPK
ncbi:MAG: PaaI family thioesterase [Pseudomonadota bacterium]